MVTWCHSVESNYKQKTIGAVLENGVFRPLESVRLPERGRFNITVQGVSEKSLNSSGSFELEALKKQRFSPKGKAERVSRSLAALREDEKIGLTREDWRFIAEDPDIELQF